MQTKGKSYLEVPTWQLGEWSVTTFKTREEFKHFVLPLFKEPGQYEFDNSSSIFNEQANIFRSRGYYTEAPEGTRDYRKYWDDQKKKCRFGIIVKSGLKQWYLPKEYYFWINFLQINDKVNKKIDFVDIWDGQYHMALYELLAELHYKHVAVVKKRQFGASYYHCAKIINLLWFEQTPILKMGASLKDYINDKGNWKFITEYKDFLDNNTAWYRPMNPDQILLWQQQIEVVDQETKRSKLKGLKGVLQGMSFEKSDTSGVGGGCTIFYYEEAGIAPTMDITLEFLLPALSSGTITTGIFIASGSVGDLDQCEPLKKLILYPEKNDIYPVTTNLLDEKSTIGTSGLFIPEQWSMPPFIDQHGNSQVEEAMKAIMLIREQWKKDLSAEKYQFRISQHPINIAEAFAFKKESPFPLHLVKAQMKRIEEKEYKTEYLDIFYNAEGKPEVKPSNKIPISEFPLANEAIDKTGVLVVWERPDKDAEWGTYYGSIDPLAEGRSTSSESLCSIYIYKTATKVVRTKTDGTTETFIEGDKVVAGWCGRFDDLRDTHTRLELIIEWYNAWTAVENNVSLFIMYMIEKRKQKYLVTKDQLLFLKDLGANANVYQEYGWKNTGVLFRSHLLSYLIEFLTEETRHDTKPDGTIVRTTYGIERIPDLMAMKEMVAYHDKLNVDRLVALAALIAFVRVQTANRTMKTRRENSTENLQKPKDLYILNKGFFKNLGHSSSGTGLNQKPHRNPFRNLK